MEILICVGSSCHLKGSYEIVNKLKELVSKNKLEKVVELKASFCLGKCSSDGVSVLINSEFIDNCRVDTIEQIFDEKVLQVLRG